MKGNNRETAKLEQHVAWDRWGEAVAMVGGLPAKGAARLIKEAGLEREEADALQGLLAARREGRRVILVAYWDENGWEEAGCPEHYSGHRVALHATMEEASIHLRQVLHGQAKALAALFEGSSPEEAIPRLPAGKTLSGDAAGGLVVVHVC